MKSFYLCAALTSVLVLSSCAQVTSRLPPNPSNPVYTIAVLPVYNTTVDIEGPRKVRQEFQKRLEGYHYAVKPIEEVDRVLRDRMGITLGTQLELTTPEEIGEVLGVDGLVYGYLLDFGHVTLGIYNVKKVRAGFKLVNAGTGDILWSRGQGVKSVLTGEDIGLAITALKEIRDAKEGLEDFRSIAGIEDIPGLTDWHFMRINTVRNSRDAAIISLGEKVIAKALRIHLMAETRVMLRIIMRDFPAGPGSSGTMKVPAGTRMLGFNMP